MMRQMRRLPFIVIPFIVLAQLSCGKAKLADFVFTVQSSIGTVKVVSQGVARAASIGEALALGDAVITDKASTADLLYGAKGLVRVYENSNVRIASLQEKMAGDTSLTMQSGKVYVTVSKLVKGSTFRVNTPTLTIAVRGTSFQVAAEPQRMRVVVLNGTVTVNPVVADTPVVEAATTVEKNQALVVDEKTMKTAIEKKQAIPVVTLKAEEVEALRREVKEIKPEVIDKLDVETKKEIKREVLQVTEDADASASREAEDRLQAERDAKLAKDKEEQGKRDAGLKDGQAAAARDAAARQAALEKEKRDRAQEAANAERIRAEQERLAREAAERAKAEKERKEKERAGNVPSL